MNKPTTEAGKRVAEEYGECVADEWSPGRGDLTRAWDHIDELVAAVEQEARVAERKRIRAILLEPYANRFWREIPDAINEAVASLDDDGAGVLGEF